MTSLQRIGAEVLGGFILLGIFVGLWMHHDTTQRALGAATCYATVTETKKQAADEQEKKDIAYSEQLATDRAASELRIQDLLAAGPVRTPIILHDGSLYTCPVASATKADDVHPASGGVEQGSGGHDIRPEVEAFKLRYEKVLTKCQQDLDDWPVTVKSSSTH